VQPAVSTDWAQSYKEHEHKVGFLDLPRELRDHIYRYTFCVPGAIFIYSLPYHAQPTPIAKLVRYQNHGPSEPQALGNVLAMGLLRTCRQLHSEGSTVLYGANTFRVWFLRETNLAPAYRRLVHHMTFTTEADYRIFSAELDSVSYWWKRRFWPTIIDNATKLLARFPHIKSITVPVKPLVTQSSWKPAFFAVENKTAEQRVALAAAWMAARCPFGSERLRECLRLEVVPPAGVIYKQEFEGSRFAPDEDEEEWDYTEFADAFEMMKLNASE
jgi:hypothetical protein